MGSLPTGTVTFLFTDIEGSTKLSQQYPSQWETLRGQHHGILQSAIDAQNGYVFQIIGDAFCVAFSSAMEALNAAVDAQRRLFNEDWLPATVRVRMGLHTGTAQLQGDGQYIGYAALAMTQRIMSAGHGGQVLLSSATHELVRDMLPVDVRLLDLGEKHLKDLQRPENLYQLSASGLIETFPPLKTLDSFPNNLPLQLTTFIGREQEITEVRQILENHRLVTLTGPGGTGKTRLSLQVAADSLETFKNGVWFVEFAPLTDPDLIPQTILSTIGIGEHPGKATLDLLKEYLQNKNTLIVLDNCEHLIKESARVANALLRTAPGLKIMASSREALGIQGEATYPVPSLSLPDPKHLPTIEQVSQYEAVRLFIDRALLVQPHFVVTNENAPAVAQICHRLDGIPLAIELAAARVKALGVDQINKRLDDRFRLLTGGSRTALERHQTLRATIDWSYNLLFREEKLLLCRLSVFLGGWDLEAAEQVCAGSNDISSSEVLDLLTHLVDKSLVILEEPRYRMLETTRQYARENLLDLEEGKMLRERHLAYFLELAENAEQEIHGPGRIDGTNRLKLDNDNIRAALDWCVSEGNTEVALRLLGVWTRAGLHHFSEIKNWFQKIRALPDIMEHPALYARLLSYMGRSSDIVGDYRHARLLMEESRALWVKLGPEGELGLAEALAFFAVISLGGETAARPLLEQSFELYQKHGNHWGMARVMFGLGLEAMWVCNYVEAEEQFKKSLAKFQELGDYAEIRRVFNMMGELARLQDDYERAGACYEQAIKTAKELGHGAQIVLLNLGWVFLHENDYHRAKVLFKESFELLNNDGNQYALILWLGGFASIFAMTGKLEHAARLFGASAQLLKNTRSLEPSDQKEFDHYVALVRAQLDDTAFAKAWAAGCEMTLEQAIAFALKETNE